MKPGLGELSRSCHTFGIVTSPGLVLHISDGSQVSLCGVAPAPVVVSPSFARLFQPDHLCPKCNQVLEEDVTSVPNWVGPETVADVGNTARP